MLPSSMTEMAQSLYDSAVRELSQQNPLVVAGVSAGSAAVLTYLYILNNMEKSEHPCFRDHQLKTFFSRLRSSEGIRLRLGKAGFLHQAKDCSELRYVFSLPILRPFRPFLLSTTVTGSPDWAKMGICRTNWSK